MPFCNLLFYAQCCDVNQPLHPPGRAVPTLREASGSSPGRWFLFQSFPGRWQGWGSSWSSGGHGVSCGSVPRVTPSPLSPPPPAHFKAPHTVFQHSASGNLSLRCLRLSPHETLAPNFQSPESPSQMRLMRREPHTPLPNSCLYKAPVCLL